MMTVAHGSLCTTTARRAPIINRTQMPRTSHRKPLGMGHLSVPQVFDLDDHPVVLGLASAGVEVRIQALHPAPDIRFTGVEVVTGSHQIGVAVVQVAVEEVLGPGPFDGGL